MVVCKSPGQRRVWPGATAYPFKQPRLRRSQPRSKPPGFGLLIVRGYRTKFIFGNGVDTGTGTGYTAPMNLTTQIIAYENGELGYDETVTLFQALLDTGMIHHLQGSYHRTAADLLWAGAITLPQGGKFPLRHAGIA